MDKVVPHFYIDANVIVDVIQGKRRDSVHLMGEIKRNNWFCSTSTFSYMETSDILKDNRFIMEKLDEGYTFKKILRTRRNKDLSEDVLKKIYERIEKQFFKQYNFIKLYDLTESGWELALGISALSNISTPDTIHLATALEAKCDLFVTSDEIFCKQADEFIYSCLPEKYEKVLKELGFNV